MEPSKDARKFSFLKPCASPQTLRMQNKVLPLHLPNALSTHRGRSKAPSTGLTDLGDPKTISKASR
jgi:hypothetical protein